MTTLLESLLSIKPKNNDFVRLDLIQGYNELEIKIIEQRYNLSIHGQFRECVWVNVQEVFYWGKI